MGNRYKCSDCGKYFGAKYCLSCKGRIYDRCGSCHWDFMELRYLLEKRGKVIHAR